MCDLDGGIILVTGGTGFIGRSLVRLLLARGMRVRLLCRSSTKAESLFGREPDIVTGDILDAGALARACRGAGTVFHIAGLYAFGVANKTDLWRTNVMGTQNLLAASRTAGVSRVVHCSTAGLLAARVGPISRTDFPQRIPMGCYYKSSKWGAERVALDFAKDGQDVTIASPTAPIGAGDDRPTPTGRMIRDLLRRSFPFYSNTGLNLISVQDVAEGLLAVGRRGRPGERYILGHTNIWLKDFLQKVASAAGPDIRVPKMALPWPMIALFGILGDYGGLRRIDDRLCWEAAYFARKRQFFELETSYEPLGWRPRLPLESAISESIAWFNGMGDGSHPST